MHIQFVYFRLAGISDAEYRAYADRLAPSIADLPGLISMVWLGDDDPEGNYGGIYTWESRADMERYLASDLFQSMQANPQLAHVTSRDFGVIEAPTLVTRGASSH